MRPLTVLVAAALTIGVLAGCGASPIPEDSSGPVTASPTAVRASEIVVGSVGENPSEEAEVFQPFADALAAQLGDHGITRGRVVVAPDTATMGRLLASGAVDLYLDSPFPAVSVAKQSGAVPFLRRWKDGVAAYRSVVFVRKDSGITSTAQLAGKRIAFEDDYSTSGFFLPKATLAAKNLRLTELATPASRVPQGVLGYAFSSEDENTMFWVCEGRADAGAMSEAAFAELAGDEAGELRVIAASRSVPRQVAVHAADLDPALVEDVSGALTRMHTTPAGAAVLADFEETARFDPLGRPDLQQLTALVDAVGTDLGAAGS